VAVPPPGPEEKLVAETRRIEALFAREKRSAAQTSMAKR